MSVFHWTAKRDAELRAIIADGFTHREAANMLGFGVLDGADVTRRLRLLRQTGRRGHVQGNVEVPRPPAPPPAPATRPNARPLIDLSRAPSSMEQRFGRSARGEG